jgi:hypothetical protein
LKIAVAVERREKRLVVEEEEEEAEEDLEDSVYMGSMLRWAKAGVLGGCCLKLTGNNQILESLVLGL